MIEGEPPISRESSNGLNIVAAVLAGVAVKALEEGNLDRAIIAGGTSAFIVARKISGFIRDLNDRARVTELMFYRKAEGTFYNRTEAV